jgi:hypothetical protein
MALQLPNAATYDSTSLNTDSGGEHRLLFRCVRGLYDLPRVRGRDTVIPGAAGRTARDRVRDVRVIELEGHIFGTGATTALQVADAESALEALRTLFDPTRDAATLVVTTSTGSKSISARPLNMVVDEGLMPVHRLVSVELEAVGADWA